MTDLAATKTQVLMFMIASLASAGLGVLISIGLRSTDFLLITVPGFVVGAFFAYKYFTFGKGKEREEQHRRSRHNKHR